MRDKESPAGHAGKKYRSSCDEERDHSCCIPPDTVFPRLMYSSVAEIKQCTLKRMTASCELPTYMQRSTCCLILTWRFIVSSAIVCELILEYGWWPLRGDPSVSCSIPVHRRTVMQLPIFKKKEEKKKSEKMVMLTMI